MPSAQATDGDSSAEVVHRIVERIEATLEGELRAVYEIGSGFGRGPRGPLARLLVLVGRVDPAVLERSAALAAEARAAQVSLRLDTPEAILRGADAFPVFSLELLDTKRLRAGQDVLAPLRVEPSDLRLRIEQSLRALHRDLLRAYLDAPDEPKLAHELRVQVRRSIYLLRGLVLVCDLDAASPPTVEDTIEVVIGHLTPAEEPTWERLRRFAAFEEALPRAELLALYGDTLAAVTALIDVVDELPC